VGTVVGAGVQQREWDRGERKEKREKRKKSQESGCMVSHVNESCLTPVCKLVCVYESGHTYEGVMSHM